MGYEYRERDPSRRRHRDCSRNRHRDRSQDRYRNCSHHRCHDCYKDRYRNRSEDRRRYRSPDRYHDRSQDHHRSRSWDRSRNRDRDRSRERYRERSRDRHGDRSQDCHCDCSRKRSRRRFTRWDASPPRFKHNASMQFISVQSSSQIPASVVPTMPPTAVPPVPFIDATTQAMTVNGINLMGHSLGVQRPQEFLDPNSPNTIYIGALPTHLTEDQVKELLVPYGQLRRFKLIRDPATRLSKGYAFCEYVDLSATDRLIDSLNWMQLGDRKLIVQRAIVGAKNSRSVQPLVLPDPSTPPTEVLCLLYTITPDELQDDKKCADILEDIKKECSKYGAVHSVGMPRPIEGMEVPGCGKVFVVFNSILDCQKARQAISGRKFKDRIVVTLYFDRDRYLRREF